MSAPIPPPRRLNPTAFTSRSDSPDPAKAGWTSKFKSNSKVWGKKAVDTSVKWSDNVGGKVNGIAERRFGTEAFWPVTGDFPREMDKAARILRAFTVDGVMTEEKVVEEGDGKEKKKTSKKVIRKIPPDVIAQAKGLCIFTSMRTGIAPFGGAGGAGLVVAKLSDGMWSAPASISPNNLSAGFLLGVDVYDCVLVIRSQKALDSFATHKATLGAEIGVAAGPYGAGAAMEAGIEKAPVFSYVRSRGMYAGVEVVGQVFVERFEENAAMYHWPGVKAGEILAGKVRVPIEAAELHRALKDAESGKAQREKGEGLDIVVLEGTDLLDLEEGEVLKLPPTPDMTDGTEHQSDPETEQVHYHSRSVSQNSSTSDFKMLPPQRHNRNVPPPLPTRSRHRPVMVEHRSSTSHYSDPDDEEAVSTAIPAIPPRPTQGDVAESHDAELTVPPVDAELTIPPVPSDEREPMSEVEGTEWDQYLAVQKEEEEEAIHGKGAAGDGNELHIQRANAADEDEGPMTYTERSEWDEFVAAHKEEESGHGGGVDPAGLAERLAGQHLDKGEGEGLR